MDEQLLESYAFEPEYTPEELEALDHEQNDGCRHQREQERRGEPDERLRRLDWCSCSNCSLMPTHKECLCCKEIELLEPFITNLNLKCPYGLSRNDSSRKFDQWQIRWKKIFRFGLVVC